MKFTSMSFNQKLVSLNAQERPAVIVYTEGRKNFTGVASPYEVCPRKEPLAHDCPMEILDEC